MRLKFLLFALLVMGLWIGALAALSSELGQTLMEQGGRQAELAAAAASRSALARRPVVQKVAMSAVTDPALVAAAAKFARSPDGPKLFEALRTAAAAAAPDELRGALIIAFVGEGEQVEPLVARGPTGEDKVGGLDLPTLARAGADGAIASVGGVQHQFVSAALVTPAQPEPKRLGAIVVGVPLLPLRFAEGLSRELGLISLKVLEGGAVVSEGGVKGAVPGAEKSVLLGQVGMVERGGALKLGPIQLPLLTDGDFLGGQAVMAIASRQALQGTPHEVLAVVSLRPSMKGLAEAQQVSLLALAGLLVLSFVWSLLMGGAQAAGAEPEPMTDPAVAAARKGEVLKIGYDASASPAAAALGTVEAPPPPEPNPDDFQFAPPPAPEPVPQPPSSLDLPPVPDSELPPPEGSAPPDPFSAFDSDRAPTRHYPTADDPFGGHEGEGNEAYNPDATRVAAVSDELLRASVRPSAEAAPATPAPSARAPVRAPAISPPTTSPGNGGGDEAHFQEVYRDFVSTRERCGEPADGLTYDKFAAKLKKNREQLIQKYSCRTVRFQVYVKEGKAALKATPVKD